MIRALADRGLEPDRILRIGRPRRIVAAVERLLTDGLDRLIVGGGDGTLGTVAPLLARSGVALGVIPLGTANDFARTLDIPSPIPAAAAVAAGTVARSIDMARANDAYFLNVASLGLSVATTRTVSARWKRRLGPSAYAVAGARAFLRHPTFRVRLSTPAGTSEGIVHQVVVGNGRFFGGGVLVAHDSTLEDGVLAAYTLGARSRWRLLRTIALLRMGVPLGRPGDIHLQTNTVHVEAWPPQPVNLDGEIRTTTPATFVVEPEALIVLTPARKASPGAG